MKKNLFLTAVIAVTALTFFGCQDPIKDLTITQTPGTAPEVAAESIIAEALSLGDGSSGILVKWDRAENGTTYNIWRREIDADNNPVDATAVELLANVTTKSDVKKIPYYFDSAVKEGVKYQYGIVSKTYKSGNLDVIQISDIVWQTVEDDKYATALAKQTTVKILENPATAPTVKLTPYYADQVELAGNKPNWGSSYTANQVKVDGYTVTVTGLTYGYDYTFGMQISTDVTNIGNSSSSVWSNSGSISWTNDNPNDTSEYNSRYFTAKLEGYTYESISFVGDISMSSLNVLTQGDYGVGWFDMRLATNPRTKGIRPVVTYGASGTLNKLKLIVKDDSTSIVEGKTTSNIVPLEGTDQLIKY